MIAVLVVEPAVDDVANVIGVRHGRMPTTRSVDVAPFVSATALPPAGATRGVGAVHRQSMFHNRPIGQHVVQVPIV
jgi:hypothetical protein